MLTHNTVTVVVVCTIADAKVQTNDCYNVYFNGCLRFGTRAFKKTRPAHNEQDGSYMK